MSEPIESLVAFRKLVAEMRHAQKQYFKERSPQWLNESKKLERMVDRNLESQGQRELFAEGGGQDG